MNRNRQMRILSGLLSIGMIFFSMPPQAFSAKGHHPFDAGRHPASSAHDPQESNAESNDRVPDSWGEFWANDGLSLKPAGDEDSEESDKALRPGLTVAQKTVARERFKAALDKVSKTRQTMEEKVLSFAAFRRSFVNLLKKDTEQRSQEAKAGELAAADSLDTGSVEQEQEQEQESEDMTVTEVTPAGQTEEEVNDETRASSEQMEEDGELLDSGTGEAEEHAGSGETESIEEAEAEREVVEAAKEAIVRELLEIVENHIKTRLQEAEPGTESPVNMREEKEKRMRDLFDHVLEVIDKAVERVREIYLPEEPGSLYPVDIAGVRDTRNPYPSLTEGFPALEAIPHLAALQPEEDLFLPGMENVPDDLRAEEIDRALDMLAAQDVLTGFFYFYRNPWLNLLAGHMAQNRQWEQLSELPERVRQLYHEESDLLRETSRSGNRRPDMLFRLLPVSQVILDNLSFSLPVNSILADITINYAFETQSPSSSTESES